MSVDEAAQQHNGAQQRPGLGSFALGPVEVDYERRIGFHELREDRFERARAALAESDLDALLLWKDENVRFVSGLRAQIIQGKSTQLNGCLLTADGELVLFLSGGEMARAEVVMPWARDLQMIPIMEARGLIAGAVDNSIAPTIQRLDLTGGRIGIDELSIAQLRELERALPDIEIGDGDALMQSVRLIKTPAEIAVMQEASAIAEAVTQTAIDTVGIGVREYEVVAEAMRTLYRLGGEMAHVSSPFVASGEHLSPPNRLASDKLIREGDLVYIDIGAMWNGYYSDMGRTVVCGKPNKRQQEVYTAVYHGLMKGTEAMKTGNTNDDVAAVINGEGEKHGFGSDFISLFIGHGIGMGANEPPYVGEALPGAETVVLEPGMTMAVEPLIWIPDVPGGAGIRLEDTIVVTDDGGVSLTRTAFDDRLLLG